MFPGKETEFDQMGDDEPDEAAPRMRVLQFRRAFSLHSELFIYQSFQLMHSRGLKLRVMTVVRYREGAERLPSTSLWRGSSRVDGGTFFQRLLGRPFHTSQPDTLIWSFLRLFLRKPAESFRADLLHAHFGPDGCLIAPIAKEYKIPFIVSFYGYDVSRLMGGPRSKWARRYRRMMRRATAAIAVSDCVAKRLRDADIPPEKIHVIRPGVAVNEFAPKEHAPVQNDGASVRCLFVGQLTPTKGPLQVIRAIDKARQRLGRRIDLHLLVVGEGELLKDCHREIQRLQLEEFVHMLGKVPRSRMPQIYAETDIYVQHSVTGRDGEIDGPGIALMEASAAGLPIVTTRHGGIPEIVIDSETGLLSPENDIDAMAKNIIQLAESPRLRADMGGRGRAHAEASFTLERSVEATMKLYETITGKAAVPVRGPEITVLARTDSVAVNPPAVSSQ